MNNPLLLLLGTGIMLGLNFPLGKLAMAAGVDAALWAAVISLGAGLATLTASLLAERGEPAGAPMLRYAVVSGFISYVVPNFLTFSVIPKLGSGLAAIMFALSPVATALLSIVFKVRPPSPLGIAGIALGFIGASIVVVERNSGMTVTGGWWIAVGLLIPVFLAAGNIYRTLAWPAGASPRRLAALTNLAAVPPLIVIALVHTGTLNLAPLVTAPWLVAMQIAASTSMFLMFFRLQWIGGPTYLSQIGYVGAVVGVVVAVAWFREVYPVGVWVGSGVIAAGIACSTAAQFRRSEV